MANARQMFSIIIMVVVYDFSASFFLWIWISLVKAGYKLSLSGLLFILLLPYLPAVNPYAVLSEEIQE